MNSSVLVAQKEKEWERPIAPPRRFNALESPPLTTSSGTSIKAAPIKSGKPEFLRGESNSTILNLSRNSSFTTTAPPTIHSAARPTPPASRVFPKLPPTVNKLESKFKPFSQFDVQDKLEFFNLLDEVSHSFSVTNLQIDPCILGIPFQT